MYVVFPVFVYFYHFIVPWCSAEWKQVNILLVLLFPLRIPYLTLPPATKSGKMTFKVNKTRNVKQIQVNNQQLCWLITINDDWKIELNYLSFVFQKKTPVKKNIITEWSDERGNIWTQSILRRFFSLFHFRIFEYNPSIIS